MPRSNWKIVNFRCSPDLFIRLEEAARGRQTRTYRGDRSRFIIEAIIEKLDRPPAPSRKIRGKS